MMALTATEDGGGAVSFAARAVCTVQAWHHGASHIHAKTPGSKSIAILQSSVSEDTPLPQSADALSST